MQHMKATRIVDSKEVWPDGTLVQLAVWRLPAASPERPHGLKYRLYCGRDGRCLVRYDNETGKGDHRHIGEREEPYRFTSLPGLLADFRADVRRLAGGGYV
jgi:uncharacterized protein YwbE